MFSGTSTNSLIINKTIFPQLSLDEAMWIGTLLNSYQNNINNKIFENEKYKPYFTKLAFKAYCWKPLPYELVKVHNAVCHEIQAQAISKIEDTAHFEYEDRQQLIKSNTGNEQTWFLAKEDSRNVSSQYKYLKYQGKIRF